MNISIRSSFGKTKGKGRDYVPKNRFKLNEENAAALIRETYRPKTIRDMEQQLLDIQSIIHTRRNFHGFRQHWMKVALYDMRIILTKTAIAAMREDWQRFTFLRYGKDFLMQTAAQDLFASVAQLNNWNHRILDKISNYSIDMQLSHDDVFHREMVLQMVDSFNRILEFAPRLDPDADIVSEPWRRTLRYRQTQYRAILSAIDTCMREKSSSNGLEKLVVAEKIEHPNDSCTELASHLNIDKSLVSRRLHDFVGSIQKYLD